MSTPSIIHISSKLVEFDKQIRQALKDGTVLETMMAKKDDMMQIFTHATSTNAAVRASFDAHQFLLQFIVQWANYRHEPGFVESQRQALKNWDAKGISTKERVKLMPTPLSPALEKPTKKAMTPVPSPKNEKAPKARQRRRIALQEGTSKTSPAPVDKPTKKAMAQAPAFDKPIAKATAPAPALGKTTTKTTAPAPPKNKVKKNEKPRKERGRQPAALQEGKSKTPGRKQTRYIGIDGSEGELSPLLQHQKNPRAPTIVIPARSALPLPLPEKLHTEQPVAVTEKRKGKGQADDSSREQTAVSHGLMDKLEGSTMQVAYQFTNGGGQVFKRLERLEVMVEQLATHIDGIHAQLEELSGSRQPAAAPGTSNFDMAIVPTSQPANMEMHQYKGGTKRRVQDGGCGKGDNKKRRQ